ncbi:MAG: DUF2334 domain-containing protein [Chloroflexi bacterium]|nr:DUF2334 domain-containing protein [Chloroflexota bacterium]
MRGAHGRGNWRGEDNADTTARTAGPRSPLSAAALSATALSTERHEPAHRWLVASVHDVSPTYLEETRLLLRALDGVGARPRVLKVVPNENGVAPLRGSPALVRLLQDEVAAGSEIVLHGYTHRAIGPYRGSRLARLRARLFAGDAAELMSVDHTQMAGRIEAGRQELRALGLEPRGFCAPAWLAPRAIYAVLRSLGFHYYVGMNALDDLTTGRRRWLPWTGYMGAGPWHERLIRLGGTAQVALAARWPVVKVFLHPQGVRESREYRHAVEAIRSLVRHRRPTTFARLLDA